MVHDDNHVCYAEDHSTRKTTRHIHTPTVIQTFTFGIVTTTQINKYLKQTLDLKQWSHPLDQMSMNRNPSWLYIRLNIPMMRFKILRMMSSFQIYNSFNSISFLINSRLFSTCFIPKLSLNSNSRWFCLVLFKSAHIPWSHTVATTRKDSTNWDRRRILIEPVRTFQIPELVIWPICVDCDSSCERWGYLVYEYCSKSWYQCSIPMSNNSY